MRHYEIVLLVHPDQSEQVPGMLDRYRSLIEEKGGSVHRSEDWGRLQLAFTIAKLHKAHYLMLNIECDNDTLSELESTFKFNDAILRHLVVRKDKAETEPSVMLKRKESKDERDSARRERSEDSSRDAGDKPTEKSADESSDEKPDEKSGEESGQAAGDEAKEQTDEQPAAAADDNHEQDKAEG